MSNDHTKFDADKLFNLKNNNCGYKFCPLCAKTLKEGKMEGAIRLFCPDRECGFIFYQNPVPAAGVILVQDEKILLVKRAHPPQIGWWCIPAGFMEWNEHPSETAIRELKEETGLDVKLNSFFEVYTGNDDPRSNAVLILYLGEIIGGMLQAADDALEVAWFHLDQLPEKIAFEAHIRAFSDYNQRIRRS